MDSREDGYIDENNTGYAVIDRCKQVDLEVYSTMPFVHKASMANKAIVLSSDDDKSDSEESIEFCDDDFDSDSSDEAVLDKVLYGLHRKQIVKEMKLKLLGKSTNVFHKQKAKKGKAVVRNDCSSHYFPKAFVTWIARRVDLKSREIILREKTIPVTKESFHTILGLPIGGLPFGTNYEAGKHCILSKFGISSLPSVKFFGDLLKHKKDLDDDRLMTAFLIVALTSFLCPNSSLYPSSKYLTIFEDIDLLDSYDWCKFVYEWCLLYIKKFQKSNSLGGCFFYWAVLYLDYVDFGPKNVPRGVPRISFWKDDMIFSYSDLDKIDENNYGLRPVKDICSTSYAEHAPDMDNIICFHDKLDTAVGDFLPHYLKDSICSLLQSHYSASNANSCQSCEDLLISVLVMLAEENVGNLVQSDDINVNVGGGDVIQGGASENPSRNTNANAYASVPSEVNNQVHCGSRLANDDVATHWNTNADEFVPLDDDLPHDVTNVGHLINSGASNSANTRNVLSVDDNGGVQCFAQSSFCTPDYAYAKQFRPCSDERTNASVVAAVAAVRQVAMKFKSRLPQINNCASGNIDVDILHPTRDLFAAEEDNVTPSSSEHCISFRSVEDIPEEMIYSKSKDELVGKTPRAENWKKRALKDITNSPEMIDGQCNFANRSKKMCATADQLYNSINHISSKPCDVSTSGGKIPQHGPREFLLLPISDQEKRYFIAVCRLSDSSRWQRQCACVFLYLWPFTYERRTCVNLTHGCAKEHINNMRAKYANEIFFHPKNKLLQTEIEDVVVNWFDPIKFPHQPDA
uniref:Aminotransferase-like plant mobile domain-containing protein n=1 Tax=Oryza meridionalis TaxID=40149 RepID=A0A0E0D3E1_9ORYZ